MSQKYGRTGTKNGKEPVNKIWKNWVKKMGRLGQNMVRTESKTYGRTGDKYERTELKKYGRTDSKFEMAELSR